MLYRVTIALSIFPALAFGREIPVQDRNERAVLRIEHDWLRALVVRDRAALDRILADEFDSPMSYFIAMGIGKRSPRKKRHLIPGEII